jgi:hypothetical protein
VPFAGVASGAGWGDNNAVHYKVSPTSATPSSHPKGTQVGTGWRVPWLHMKIMYTPTAVATADEQQEEVFLSALCGCLADVRACAAMCRAFKLIHHDPFWVSMYSRFTPDPTLAFLKFMCFIGVPLGRASRHAVWLVCM